ncbi:MAG: hypothetical protein RIA09_16290 [Hoeflea sp.]|jgi:hypothetical protein|uniref:hypothetical protein n=1 Tax=Hoeflea sp. TaxID=1940281 RepID=UPI0032EED956
MGSALTTLANKFLAMQNEETNPWTEAGQESGFFGSFLKFSGNDGKYSYGKKDEEEYLDDGHELIADLIGVEHGHICWVEGQAKDEINYLVMDRPKLPSIDSLPNYGPYKTYNDGSEDGWQEQIVLKLYSPELDQAFTLKLTGGGKLRAGRSLIAQFGKKGVGKIGKDGLPMFPVIELGSNSFQLKDNPKAGTKYAPVFKIIDFEEMSAFADVFEEGGDDKDEDDPSNYEAVEDKREDKAEEASSRSRRDSRDVEDAEVEDVTDRSSRSNKAEEKAEERPSRRARTVHAEPQDEDENEEETKASRRGSARGRRGRNG